MQQISRGHKLRFDAHHIDASDIVRVLRYCQRRQEVLGSLSRNRGPKLSSYGREAQRTVRQLPHRISGHHAVTVAEVPL